ncbi:MAG: hypothetical protein K2H70_05690, partial [Bacteroidales bacterium]|nr:hypothetical protein [Bacteroidales bacterium]
MEKFKSNQKQKCTMEAQEKNPEITGEVIEQSYQERAEEYADSWFSFPKKKSTIAPTRINDVALSSQQQEALRHGELVVVKNVSHGDEKKTLAVKLDSEKGFQKMEVPFFMENAPLSEIKELWNVNARFNEQLKSFDRGSLKEQFSLGMPLALLQTCDLLNAEIVMTPSVLKKHLHKH